MKIAYCLGTGRPQAVVAPTALSTGSGLNFVSFEYSLAGVLKEFVFVIAVRSLSVSLAESYFNPARQHCFAKELAQFSRSLPGTRAPYLHSALFPRVIRAEFFPHGIQLESVRHGEVYPTGSQFLHLQHLHLQHQHLQYLKQQAWLVPTPSPT